MKCCPGKSSLSRVPGHRNVKRNHEADRLVKLEAVVDSTEGLDLPLPTIRAWKEVIEKRDLENHSKAWQNQNDCFLASSS